MSSALPSRDSESLIRDGGVEMLESTRSGHEAGWFALDLRIGQVSPQNGNRVYLQWRSTECGLLR
jgi:hypothetical protein